MSVELSESEQLTYSTVRIECELAQGGMATGTGFFYRFAENGDVYVPAIVTNRHVVEGAKRGRLHLNLADSEGQPLSRQYATFVIEDFNARWIPHPDEEVDLCVMPIAPLHLEAEQRGQAFFYVSLNGTLVPNREELSDLTAMEEVVMVGYPNGIWDSVNNMPVIRRGITATHPNLDYDGKQDFMIDAACFPGSSGSPVFLFNMGSYAARAGGIVLGSRIKLSGVLYAGPQHLATGEIQIVNVPTVQRPVAYSSIPNNLGVVLKAHRLYDFDPVFEQMRQEDTAD